MTKTALPRYHHGKMHMAAIDQMDFMIAAMVVRDFRLKNTASQMAAPASLAVAHLTIGTIDLLPGHSTVAAAGS